MDPAVIFSVHEIGWGGMQMFFFVESYLSLFQKLKIDWWDSVLLLPFSPSASFAPALVARPFLTLPFRCLVA